MKNFSSFINGAIAGAGITLSIISIAFLQIMGSLEGKMGFTTTEIRIAIFLGFVVFAVSLLYEACVKKIWQIKPNGRQV